MIHTEGLKEKINRVNKTVPFIDAGDAWRGAPSSATFDEHDGADKRQDPPLFQRTHFFNDHEKISSTLTA